MKQVQGIGKLCVDALWAGENLKYVYNRTKDRREIWHRCRRGDRELVLFDAIPARTFSESFIGPVQFVPAILGVNLDRAWDCNGNPAPVAGNFVSANEIGGGLILRCLGAAPDDWVALQTGGNYPVTIEQSPHLHFTVGFTDTAGVYKLIGLVGADNLETGDGAAWTVPDDGMWIEYDTDVNTNLRFVTRKNGVQASTNLGVPPAGHSSIHIRVNDAGTQAEIVLNGTIVAIHTVTNLPTDQLKPLAMEGSRAGGAVNKEFCFHDFRLIFDHGVEF